MQTVQMSHPKYGERQVDPDRVISYERTGWARTDVAEATDLLDGTVDDVLAHVGDSPVAAATVLEAEKARPKPRKTLVDALEAIAATLTTPEV